MLLAPIIKVNQDELANEVKNSLRGNFNDFLQINDYNLKNNLIPMTQLIIQQEKEEA